MRATLAVAIALLVVLSYAVLAENPAAVPVLTINTNASLANASTNDDAISPARSASDELVGYANFSADTNGTQEHNSTYTWYIRSQYNTSGLVGYWKLDSNANDSSGKGNDGTISGAAQNQSENCAVDNCFLFDGVDDSISIGDSGFNVEEGTVVMWVRTAFDSTMSGARPVMWVWGDDASHISQSDTFDLQFRNAGDNIRFNAGDQEATTGAVLSFGANEWHHVAATWDRDNGTGGFIRIYYDGVKVADTDPSFDAALPVPGTNNFIGRGNTGGQNPFFNGSLDEVAIYNRAKSSEEIARDYENSRWYSPLYRDAMLYMHFDGLSGNASKLVDSAGRSSGAHLEYSENITNVSGIIGDAFSFRSPDNPGNARINVSSMPLGPYRNMSMSAWVKPRFPPGNIGYFNYVISGRSQSGSTRFYLWFYNDGRLLGIYTNATSYQHFCTYNNDLQPEQWHQLVSTFNYNGSAVMTLYVNGEQACQQVNIVDAWDPGTHPTTQAIKALTIGDSFNGSIDEVGIWNKTLSLEEVQDMYKRTWHDEAPQTFLLQPQPKKTRNDTVNTTLVAHLDDFGPVLNDSSGYGHTGNVSGAGFVNNSVSGFALSFDGVDDHANVSHSSAITFGPDEDHTIMAWVYPKSLPDVGGEAVMVAKGVPGVGADYYLGLFNSGGTQRLYVDSNSYAEYALPTGKWTHMVFTYDGDTQDHVMYLNGVDIPFTAESSAAKQTGSDPLYIGHWDNIRYFNGSVDEIKIVNRTLTAAEVAAEYTATCPFCTTDAELPASSRFSITYQPGRYAENYTPYENVTSYWRLDNVSTDIGQTKSSLIIFGPQFVNDSVSGQALSFDGNDDYAVIDGETKYDIVADTEITVQVWIKPTAVPASIANIVAKDVSGTDRWRLNLQENNGGASVRWLLDPSGTSTIDAPYNISLDEWHYLVATYSDITDDARLYIDGALAAQGAVSGDIITGANLSIGGDGTGGFPFQGLIDEVRILNRTLSHDEILADYEKQASGLGILSGTFLNYSAANNFDPKEGTVEMWVKPDWDAAESRHFLFATSTPGDGEIEIEKQDGVDTLRAWLRDADTQTAVSTSTGWLAGDWHHFALTWNNRTGSIEMYLDGALADSYAGGFEIKKPEAFYIGTSSSAASTVTCNCTISEFRMSRRALTAYDINQSYNKGHQFFQNEILLNETYIEKDRAFKLSYTPQDVTGYGAQQNSTPLYFTNTPPPLPTIIFPTENIVTARNELQAAVAPDADGDTLTYYWYVDGELISVAAGNITHTSSDGFHRVNISAYDGTEWSENSTYVSFNYISSPPSAANASITSSANTTATTFVAGETIAAYTNMTDANLEGNSSFAWQRRTLYQPQNRSLAGYWTFDHDATDSSAHGHQGNVSGAVLNDSQNCRFDDCYFFDGQDAIITTDLNLSSSSFTVEFWMMPVDIVNYGDPISAGYTDFHLTFVMSEDGSMQYATGSGSGWGDAVTTTAGSFEEGKWYHVAGTKQGSTLSLYINGQLNGTATNSNIPNDVITIGGRASSYDFNGSIDEVAVYNYAKSAQEILTDYQDTGYDRLADKNSIAAISFDNHFNDTQGHTVNAITNVGFAEGIADEAASFDGSSSYLRTADSADLELNADNFSYSVWIKTPVSTGTRAYVFERRNAEMAAELQFLPNPQGFQFGVTDVDGTSASVKRPYADLNDDVWHHVAVTGDRTNGNLTMYIDGAYANSSDISSLTGINSSAALNFVIGRSDWSADHYFDGLMDEFVFYNKTLSANEVEQLYHRTWKGNTPQTLLISPSHPQLLDDDTGNTSLLLHFDERTGSSSVTESSGKSYSINVSSTAFVNDSISGNALHMQSENNYVNVSLGGPLYLPDALTIMTWVKTADDTGSIVSARGDGTNQQYAMRLSAGSLVFDRYLPSGEAVNSQKSINDNEWHHVAVTMDDAANQVIFYVDGEREILAYNETYSGGAPTVLTIGGAFSPSFGDGLSGTLDELKIVNRTMTAEEISADYKKTCPFCTTDGELSGSNTGAIWQPGKYVNNLSDAGNTTLYLKLDDNSNTVTDSSGYGNDGAMLGSSNATWTNDSVSGLALSFDASDDAVEISYDDSLNLTSALTVQAWVKPATYGGRTVVGYAVDGEDIPSWNLQVGGTNQFFFAGSNDGATNHMLASSPNSYEANRWYHIAGTYDGSSASLYVDGQLVAVDNAVEAIAPKTGSIKLGTGYFTGHYSGLIDEVRVTNRSLSAAEIRTDYVQQATGLGIFAAKTPQLNYSSENLNPEEGTIEMWFKPLNDFADGGVRVLMEHSTLWSSDDNLLKMETVSGSGAVRFYSSDTGNLHSVTSTSTFAQSSWHHVAAVWDNRTGDLKLYIDGVEEDADTGGITVPQALNSEFHVGWSKGGTGRYCDCVISDFRISSRALTTEEINHSYSKGRSLQHNEQFLDENQYSRGQAFKLSYTPEDEFGGRGSEANSSSILMQNTVPTAPSIVFPTSGLFTTLNHLNATFAPDADDDAITLYWYVNGEFNHTSSGNSTLTAVDGSYAINVSTFDGSAWSANDSVSFTLDTAAPSLSVVPLTVANDSTINSSTALINVTVTDANFDKLYFNLSDEQNVTLWDGDIVGRWHLDENTGTAVNDSSGNELGGTLVNSPVWIAGRYGAGINFTNGSNQRVDLTDNDLFDITDDITIGAWIQPVTSGDSSEGGILSRGGAGIHGAWGLQLGSGTGLLFWQEYEGTGAGEQDLVRSATGIIALGTWQYVTAVRDRSAGEVRFYVNGTLMDTQATQDLPIKDVDRPTSIGNIPNNPLRDFDGIIDEVTLWDKALTAEEIAYEYNKTARNYLTSHSVSGDVHTITLNATNLTDGNYSYVFSVSDKTGASAQGAGRELNTDTTRPAISIDSSSTANNSVSTDILVNITANDSSEHNQFSTFIDFDNSLVAWYRFEEQDGTTTNDSSTRGNDGTLTGFGCTDVDCDTTDINSATGRTSAGRRGQAMVFDGVNDGVIINQVPLHPVYDRNYTISLWFRTRQYVGFMLAWGNTANNNARGGVRQDGSNFQLQFYNDTGTALVAVNGAGVALGTDQWYHGAVVVTNGVASLYVNGSKVSTSGDNFIQDSTATYNTFRIGYMQRSTAINYDNSSIDEVMLFNRSLSDAEIAAIYQGQLSTVINATPEGDHNYTAYSVDVAGNLNQTAPQFVTIDTSAPSLTVNAPTPANDSALNRTDMLINATTTDTHPQAINLEMSGSSTSNTTLWSEGLVGMWHFEEDNGSAVIRDDSGHNHNATPFNINWTGNVSGLTGSPYRQGFKFDGINDQLGLNDTIGTVIEEDITISAWIRRDNANFGRIIDQYTIISFNTGEFVSDGGQSARWNQGACDDMIVGEWAHFVGTIDGDANNATISAYKNGVLCEQRSTNAPMNDVTFQFLNFGQGVADRENPFNGSIDEVKIWNRSISQAEVQAEYNRTYKNFWIKQEGNTAVLNATNLTDGNYTYRLSATDDAGNTVQASQRTLLTDTAYPAISIDATSSANNSIVQNLIINITTNDSSEHNDFSAFVDFNQSLVGWWRFEDVTEAANSTTPSETYGRIANLSGFDCLEMDCDPDTGAGWTSAGARGKALAFDGVDDYGVIGSTDLDDYFDANTSWTVLVWAKANQFTEQGGIFSNRYADSEFIIIRTSTTEGQIDYKTRDSVGTEQSASATGVAADTWHQYGIIRQSGGDIYFTYDDTVVSSSSDDRNSDFISDTAGHEYYIGQTIFSGDYNQRRYFNGSVDEVQIWNRALSLEEINASYSAGTYRLEKTFSSEWPDGNYSYTAYAVDRAGNLNTTENRTVALDNTGPVIDAIAISSNNSPYFHLQSNSSTAATIYFSTQSAVAADIDVSFTEINVFNVHGNTTFGQTPVNDTFGNLLRYTFTPQNSSSLITVNDSAGLNDTATITWLLDLNDTTTSDDSSADYPNAWNTTNVTITLTATDSGAGVNRTYYCIQNVGSPDCTPAAYSFSNPLSVQLNCSSEGTCQQLIRYYSIDNVSNNESGGDNGGLTRSTYPVYIQTGSVEVENSTVNNSQVLGGAIVSRSVILNSSINGTCAITNAHVERSSAIYDPSLENNCSVSDSTIIDVNLTSSIIRDFSYIDPSTIIDSVVVNSSIENSTVQYSRIENSTFCGNFTTYEAVILNGTLVSGQVTHNDTDYFGPFSLASICTNLPPSAVGILKVVPAIVKDGDTVLFEFTAPDIGFSVTINDTELQMLDNDTPASISLTDDGVFPDQTANDAVYTATHQISAENNISDGNYTLHANITDNLGNYWRVHTNVTLDNTVPNASITINEGDDNATNRLVTLYNSFNDSIGIQDCRYANEDRAFVSWESCTEQKVWTLSELNGEKTVVLQARDIAGNVNETNDTIILSLAATTAIVVPQAGTLQSGSVNVVVAAPSGTVYVEAYAINASNASQSWSLAGASGARSNDTSPGDGFTFTWSTASFADDVYNLSVLSIGAGNTQISNATAGSIRLDNTAPAVTIGVPATSSAYNRLVHVNATASEDTAQVTFEYRESSSASWQLIAIDDQSPWGANWDTSSLTDGTDYQVRANATDAAGLSGTDTNINIELDNTGPSVTLTNPVAGSTVSSDVNVTFTILGTAHSREIQFDGGSWSATETPLSHLWDTTTVPDGSHLIRVRANDSLNNTGYSDYVIVQVDNGASTVILLEPESNTYQLGSIDLTVSAPGATTNVTFNVSNATGFFNTTASGGQITQDTQSSDGWKVTLDTRDFAENSVYTITVRAYDASLTLLGLDSAVNVEFDNTPPNTPTNLSIDQSPVDTDGTLVLTWLANASEDISHYNLYRSVSYNFTIGTGTFIKSVSGNGTTDAVPEGIWHYKVTQVDGSGKESNTSNEANTTVSLSGPTGTFAANQSILRNGNAVKFTFTSADTGLTSSINATELSKIDSVLLDGFESVWTSSDSATLNATLNLSDKQGTYANRLLGFAANTSGYNVTRQISPVNLSGRNKTLLWIYSNTTGTFLDLGFGEDRYNNFTVPITIPTANVWVPVELELGNLSATDIDEIQYLMLNVTSSTAFDIIVDDLRAAAILEMKDDGLGDDENSGDGIYTAVRNITAGNNAPDGTKSVRAHVSDGSGSLAPAVSLTLDNTAPLASIIINDDDAFTISRTVTLTLNFSDETSGISQCRYSNLMPVTTNYEACEDIKVWQLESGKGLKTVYYEVRDQAGNTNLTNDTITLDTDAPVIVITSPAPGAYINGTINVTFSGNESAQPAVSIDGGNYTNTTNTTYHTLDTTTLTDGTHTLRVRDTDEAGNIGYSEPLLVEVDNTAPSVSIVSPQPGTTVSGVTSIVVAVSDDTQSIEALVDNGSGFASIGTDSSGTNGWSISWNASASCALNCSVFLMVNATDLAGHEGNASIPLTISSVSIPAVPNLTLLAEIDTDAIVPLNWSPVGGAVYYNLYRSPNVSFQLSPGTLVKNITANVTTDQVQDGTWYYKVTAVSSTGGESLPSNEVNTTVAASGAITNEDLFGTLAVNDSIVTNGSTILFTFEASALDLNVTINGSYLQLLDNQSSALELIDSGQNGDLVMDDATYSAFFTIGTLNNATQGLKQIFALVNDTLDNEFAPFVNVMLDVTAPNASVEILGVTPAGLTNVSSEITTSRIVSLLSSFNDTNGVEQCRFAEEDRAFNDWQDCTEVTSWLLSDGAGNKTAVLQVKDNAGLVTEVNDTIVFNTSSAGLDGTAPTTPTVIDSGLYTNTLHRLDASWNSTDAESAQLGIALRYEYRISYNDFANLLINWTDAGSATSVEAVGLNLTNGTNYTFEVRAINGAGLRSDTGYSDGITTDVSAPSLPIINSSNAGSWSSQGTLSFNFSSNDTISGVAGYSYLLTLDNGAFPDDIAEEETDHVLLLAGGTDGNATTLKYNSTGNAASAYVQVAGNSTKGDVLRVTVRLAESHVDTSQELGLSIFAVTSAPTAYASPSANVSTMANLTQDVAFASDITTAQTYTAEIALSQDVSDAFIVIAGNPSDDDNTYNLLLATRNATGAHYYVCSEAGSCANQSNLTVPDVAVQRHDVKLDGIWDYSAAAPDGTVYFKVKARDNAGNWGPTATASALVDTSGPSTPQMVAPVQSTNSSSVAFNWTEASDPESGVSNYFLQVANDSEFTLIEYGQFVGNQTNATVTVSSSGTYHARVLAQNGAGVNGSFSGLVQTVVDTQAPQILFLKPSSSGAVVSTDVTVVTKTDEQAVCDITGATPSVARANFTFTNSTYHETQISAATGANSWSVRCQDALQNQVTQALSFTVNTGLSPTAVSLPSAGAYTEEAVTLYADVTSSGTGLGELAATSFNLTIAGAAYPIAVADNGNGNYSITFTAPAANGTYTMELTVGSASDTATLDVSSLLFTVQYTGSSLSSAGTSRIVYSVVGDYSIGVAADGAGTSVSGSSSQLSASTNALSGDAFVFVSRASPDVERTQTLLEDQTFLDAVKPSFGYSIDTDTYLVFTDLSYDDITLDGNGTLNTGRHTLIVENAGFDATTGKKRLTVSIQ